MAADRQLNGFTLIEMLIAMTLLGIMVVLLFSSLKISAESWNAGESKIVEVNRKAVVYQFFKRHLTTIRPVLEKVNSNFETHIANQLAFQGKSQTLRFVASLPASAARKGLQLFEIAPDINRSSTLMVALSPYLQAGNVDPERAVLLENVKAFGFSYFGNKDPTANPVWQDEWFDMDRLPLLIKVSILLDDGSYWPAMVFPVRISGQVSTFGPPAAGNNQTLTPSR